MGPTWFVGQWRARQIATFWNILVLNLLSSHVFRDLSPGRIVRGRHSLIIRARRQPFQLLCVRDRVAVLGGCVGRYLYAWSKMGSRIRLSLAGWLRAAVYDGRGPFEAALARSRVVRALNGGVYQPFGRVVLRCSGSGRRNRDARVQSRLECG